MNRRSFVKTASAAPALAFATNRISRTEEGADKIFKMKFAPHIGMFKHHAGENVLDQLKFMADQGFTAFEDNGMKAREVSVQEAMANVMESNKMEMGVFVAHKIYWNEANLASGKEDLRQEFLKDIKESIQVAKRVNARWMTVVPGHLDLRKDMAYQTVHVIDSLRYACDLLEDHALTMVLEPLNFRDHPGLFLTKIGQAYELCRAVKSPSCKILFDIYHQQIQEGNIIPNIDLAWSEIAYFQIGDNPGRKEPTTGEINYKNIFKHIDSKDYQGILGMEHGNMFEGIEGEKSLIAAYRSVDLS